jgi:DNA-directed RNA polymerase specialized sigma24 family protein
MQDQNKPFIKALISRHDKKIFALALYLSGGDKDKAYTIAVSAFAQTLRGISPLEKDETIFNTLLKSVVDKTRETKTIVTQEAAGQDFATLPSFERESLRMMKLSLQKIPFEKRAILLLRDQLHLSYQRIAGILKISAPDAKVKTNDARIELRETMKELLSHGR